jgi:hypothetical protein
VHGYHLGEVSKQRSTNASISWRAIRMPTASAKGTKLQWN